MIKLVMDDCLAHMKTMDDSSVDALITDPPAGISFMGKDWDSGNNFIPAMTEIFKETLRVLKPGAHGLVWALPRTSHWTATALEGAGFEIRDVITHLFGTGFPKSHNISKSIDKEAGAEREVVGKSAASRPNAQNHVVVARSAFSGDAKITCPATELAKKWQGWGTALKPSNERWILCRKPILSGKSLGKTDMSNVIADISKELIKLQQREEQELNLVPFAHDYILIRKPCSEKTVAKNVEKWGCGGVNVDECRIVSNGEHKRPAMPCNNERTVYGSQAPYQPTNAEGRFPANLILSHNEDCEESPHVFPDGSTQSGCSDGCAVAALDEQSGLLKTGGSPATSRFFYCAKASRADRNGGCEGLNKKEITTKIIGKGLIPRCHTCGGWRNDRRAQDRPKSACFCEKPDLFYPDMRTNENNHPTVKPTKLMEYLITLITPPGGVVLDPFMGSGSTGKAAKHLGFGFVGIEKEAEYFAIAEARVGQ